MPNNILLTGGKGKTGTLIGELLTQKGFAYQIATRHPVSDNEVTFDWMRPDLADAAFNNVKALYIVAPTNTSDHGTVVLPLLEIALRKGVQRFVLLSASSLEAGAPMMGKIHTWLVANAPEWVVLRPTWFMQNFYEQRHLTSIKAEHTLYSATGDGKVGFIDALDIARAAVSALTSDKVMNRDFILTGPQALSYADVAAALSQALGKKISHTNLTISELSKRLQHNGLDENYAQILAAMDGEIMSGAEDRTTGGVNSLTGVNPGSLEAFIHRELHRWGV
ncbi:ergot alkaloid biosynthesis protein [Rouxiella sp. Mn2063]|uniref:ergot alkaloid biosynthesis protein n=1 Tax=Rouxiella sp. Mn2063 TaxID=3395262 RepID=UPI003BEC8368